SEPVSSSALAQLAVSLLSGSRPDLERGATLAIERDLGGLYLHGLESMCVPAAPSVMERLRKQARRESGHFALASSQITLVLDSFRTAGVIPIALKGQPLARA